VIFIIKAVARVTRGDFWFEFSHAKLRPEVPAPQPVGGIEERDARTRGGESVRHCRPDDGCANYCDMRHAAIRISWRRI
jgi:hypothetical protein